MTEIERQILEALLEFENIVANLSAAGSATGAAPKPDLLPVFRRLDELTAQLPSSTDPNLLHYLHKKSYEKARLFLQGRESENQAGHCRHV